MAAHLNRHQADLAVPPIGDREGGQATAGTWQRMRKVDPEPLGDQGFGRWGGGRGLDGGTGHAGGVSGQVVDK
ncbi:MAG TPA: hypothetical protein VFE41_33425 [Acetobacteraceae bacterium]|jgi:hypothetical protein|nr:hypothetical protein [Acetobacteraceae bacterium]